MRVLLRHVHGLGDLVPVAPLESVDHAGGDVDRAEHQRQGAGEVLAMPLLAVDEEVLDRVELGVLHIHAERIAELVGVAEVRLQGPGPGLAPLAPFRRDGGHEGLGDLAQVGLERLGDGEQPLVVGQVGRLFARLETGGVGVGEHFVVVGADPGVGALERAVDRVEERGQPVAGVGVSDRPDGEEGRRVVGLELDLLPDKLGGEVPAGETDVHLRRVPGLASPSARLVSEHRDAPPERLAGRADRLAFHVVELDGHHHRLVLEDLAELAEGDLLVETRQVAGHLAPGLQPCGPRLAG